MKKYWNLILAIILISGLIEVVHVFFVGQVATGASDKIPWGLDVPAYIFLTGLSSGAYFISVLWLFGLDQFKSVSRIAAVQAMILVMIAPAILLIAMGHPGRFWMIYIYANPTSVIAWGAYLLMLYLIFGCLYAYYMMRGDMQGGSKALAEKDARRARLFGIIGLPIAITVNGYSGVLLGFIKGRILWHSPMMPVLFLTSAILSGVALLIIVLMILKKYSSLKTDENVVRILGKIMFVALIVEMLFVGAEVLTGLYGRTGEHFEAWSVLLFGKYAFLFVGVGVLFGLVLPFSF